MTSESGRALSFSEPSIDCHGTAYRHLRLFASSLDVLYGLFRGAVLVRSAFGWTEVD